MFNDKHTLEYMAMNEAKRHDCAVQFLVFSFSVAAHGGPACSGNHRKDSAGHLPHEARTTQQQCCLPHKDSPPASWFQCTAQCEGPPWCQHTSWASVYCRDPFHVWGPAGYVAPVQWLVLHLMVFLKNDKAEEQMINQSLMSRLCCVHITVGQSVCLNASETARPHWTPPTPTCSCPLSGYWHHTNRRLPEEVGLSKACLRVKVQMTFIQML